MDYRHTYFLQKENFFHGINLVNYKKIIFLLQKDKLFYKGYLVNHSIIINYNRLQKVMDKIKNKIYILFKE